MENKNIYARLRERRLQVLARFPNAVLDEERFVSKFIGQIDDLRRHFAALGFYWIDETKPQTLDNLGWSEEVKVEEKRREKEAGKAKEPVIQSRDLTPQQWVAELLEERSRINRS